MYWLLERLLVSSFSAGQYVRDEHDAETYMRLLLAPGLAITLTEVVGTTRQVRQIWFALILVRSGSGESKALLDRPANASYRERLPHTVPCATTKRVIDRPNKN